MKIIYITLFTFLFISCKEESINSKEFENSILKENIDSDLVDDKLENSEKNVLDYLNKNIEEFKFEKDINNIGFIVLTDGFDYYKKPIIVTDSLKNEILKIEVIESDFIAKYKNKIYDRTSVDKQINPWYLSLSYDYFGLSFLCEKIDDNFFQVRLNEKDLGFINKNNNNFKLVSVDEFIKDNLVLGFDFKRNENPLRNLPNENSEIVDNNLENKYSIWRAEFIEMKGEWIKVKLDVSNEIGWIRWKNKNKMNIRMYFTC